MSWRGMVTCLGLIALLAGCSASHTDVEPGSELDPDTSLSCPPSAKDGGDETDGGVGGTGKLPEQCRDRGE